MKLTPRSEGYRYTKTDWPPDWHVDITWIGRSTVKAVDQTGKEIEFTRNEMDNAWVRLGTTVLAKRIFGR